MTLEERLVIIEQKANSDKAKEREKKTDLQTKTEETLCKVEELTPRIKALITVANKCIEEGISFPSSTETTKFGYGDGYKSYNFLADGIHHHVGFMDVAYHNAKKIQYIGIDEGGFCGVWDFYTNGIETFLKHERNGSVKDAELSYMNDFLKEFDMFEESFYKWVDSMAE